MVLPGQCQCQWQGANVGMGVSGVDWRGNRQQSVGDAQAATIHVHIGPWLRFDLRPGLRHADCGYSHGRAAGIGFAR